MPFPEPIFLSGGSSATFPGLGHMIPTANQGGVSSETLCTHREGRWFPKGNLGHYKGERNAGWAKKKPKYACQWTIKKMMPELNFKR